MKRSIFFLIITFLLISISQQSYAYKLFGYKWPGGAYNYYINPIGVDNSVDYSSKSSTVIAAAAEWTSVSTTNVQVNYMGTTTNTLWGELDYENVVTWKTDGWSGSVIGLSISWYGGSENYDSDIKLNTAFANDPRMSQLVTHEVGHSLGIGHTRESGDTFTQDEYNAIMYWLLHSQTGLNSEDKCAITAIYPASGSCSPTFAAGYFTCEACCADNGAVSVSITNDTYTYSGTVKSVTVTTTPAGLAHTVTYRDLLNNVVASPTDAGTYDVEVDITEPGYESEGPFYGTLTINKKTLNVSADNIAIDYGDPEPTYTYSISGFVSGENASNLLSTPTANIVEPWPVDPGSYTIYVSGGSADNYSFSYQDGTLTVNGLSVNNVWVSNYLYTYDGTNKEITVTTDPPGVGNIVAYKLNGVPVATQEKAGVYDVTITIDEPGYNPDIYITTMTINQAPLTATADDKSVSIGDPEPVYTISYNGFVNGENSTVLTTQATADVLESWPLSAGTYSIVSSGATDENYSITHINGTLTVSAFTADSVKFNNLTYDYDGLAHYPSVTTYPNGLNYSINFTNSSNAVVGNPTMADSYTVEVTITEPGYVQDKFQSILTINKVDLEISVDDTTIVYGAPEPNYSYTYIGFVNNETEPDLDLLPVATTGLGWPLLPDTYTIWLSGGFDQNYNYLLNNGVLTVQEAQVDSVHFSELSYIYDGLAHQANIEVYPDTVDVSVTYYDSLANFVVQPIDAGEYLAEVIVTETGFVQDTFYQTLQIEKANLIAQAKNYTVEYATTEPAYAIAYSGFVNSEDSTVLDSLPTTSVEGTWPLLPGDYPITISGGGDNNYRIQRLEGLLSVESRSVSLTNTDTIQTYNGQAREATVRTVPDDVEVEVTYLDEADEPIAPPTLPGAYKVRSIITEVGYEPLELTSSFTINKATLTVTVQNFSIDYGDDLPDFTYSLSGFVNGETEAELSNLPLVELLADAPYLPGDYTLSANGGSADNYNFIYVNGTFTVLPLTIEDIQITNTNTSYTGLSQSLSVETVPADLSYSIAWFNGEQLMAGTPRNAGTYNYVLTIDETGYINSTFEGNLSIGKALLTVSMDTARLSYGAALPSLSLKITGFVNDETSAEIDELPGITSITEWPWDAGEYSLSIAGGTANNYSFQYEPGVLIIYKSLLIMSADNASMNYGETIPDLNYTVSGFQFDDDASAFSTVPQLSVDGEQPLQPGNHPINISGADAPNYFFEYIPGTLWVEPIGEASFVVSGLDTSYTGVEQSPDIQTDPEGLAYSVDYSDTPLNAGSYTVQVGLAEPGYLPMSQAYEMNIRKAKLTVSAKDTTVLLGDEEPEYEIIYDGFVNEEDLDVIDQLPIATVTDNWNDLAAGAYPITFHEGSDNNYEFIYINGGLTVIQTYWIKIIAGENGSVSQTANGTLETTIEERVPVNESSSEFLAIADDGYSFSAWDDGSTVNPRTLENVAQDITLTALFEQKVGIANLSSQEKIIKVFPNPVEANTAFYIRVDLPEEDFQNSKLMLFDATGRLVETITELQETNALHGLKRGVYQVRIVTGNMPTEVFRLMVR